MMHKVVLFDRKCMIHPHVDTLKCGLRNLLFESNSNMDKDENDNADIEDGKETSEDGVQGLFRKRKRRNSNVVSETSSVTFHAKEPEPENKKSKRLSLAALFTTPIKPVLKIGASLQGSSGKSDLDEPVIPQRKSLLRRSCSILRPSMGPPPVPSAPVKVTTPQKQRLTRSWSQSVACLSSSLTTTEVKRQEAIYELYIGENGMVQDLDLVKTTYRSSLLQLNILAEDEIECIFGDLDALFQLHSSLRDKLQSVRETSGVIKTVGHVLMQWVPGLECYMSYFSRHIRAKAVLDEQKDKNKRFQDFLRRCIESPFSRKLDLWNFLDIPRSRIVKYPILISEILKHTPVTHPDSQILPQVLQMLSPLLQKADRTMGEAECKYTLSRLVWSPELKNPEASIEALQSAIAVVCEGDLRDHRGTKMHCLLFDVGFLVTRANKQTDKLTVLWPLIPAAELETDEIEPLRSSRNSNRCFKVTSADSSANVCHVFSALDEHSKKRWMDSIKQVLQSTLLRQNTATQRPLSAPLAEPAKKRSIHAHRRSISDQALVPSSPLN